MATPIENNLADQLAQAIGEVCLKWSYIETIVADMALHLAAYKDLAYDNDSVRHPLLVAVMHMKLRERVFLVKALAHEVKEPEDYFDRLTKLLSVIDSELTIERNRFIHDIWDIEANSMVRFQEGPKVIKPQAKKRELIMGTGKTYADISEVRLFIRQLEETTSSLIDLENELAGLMIARERRPE